MPIILDSELHGLTNRANAKTKCFAAPSLKRKGRIKTSREQLATQIEYGSMTAHAYALGRTAVRADADMARIGSFAEVSVERRLFCEKTCGPIAWSTCKPCRPPERRGFLLFSWRIFLFSNFGRPLRRAAIRSARPRAVFAVVFAIDCRRALDGRQSLDPLTQIARQNQRAATAWLDRAQRPLS